VFCSKTGLDYQKEDLLMTQKFYSDEIKAKTVQLFQKSLMSLIREASAVHEENWLHKETLQKSRLLSIKTGGCQEDCGYCSQSRHHETNLQSSLPVSLDTIYKEALQAKKQGATRFCMGAAWKAIPNRLMPYLCKAVQTVKDLGLETCVTLGSLSKEQALELQNAGCDFYNHNIDTSPSYYPNVVSTRTFEERLQTLKVAREAGLKVCCGGILGLGESQEDRIEFLSVLASFEPQPESVPINQLVPIPGTPLGYSPPPDLHDFLRVIAAARILMPKSRIRLAAGRNELSKEAQVLCFFAGANSLFIGDQLLTTPLPGMHPDGELLKDYFEPAVFSATPTKS
jgi:biotin synthase